MHVDAESRVYTRCCKLLAQRIMSDEIKACAGRIGRLTWGRDDGNGKDRYSEKEDYSNDDARGREVARWRLSEAAEFVELILGLSIDAQCAALMAITRKQYDAARPPHRRRKGRVRAAA